MIHHPLHAPLSPLSILTSLHQPQTPVLRNDGIQRPQEMHHRRLNLRLIESLIKRIRARRETRIRHRELQRALHAFFDIPAVTREGVWEANPAFALRGFERRPPPFFEQGSHHPRRRAALRKPNHTIKRPLVTHRLRHRLQTPLDPFVGEGFGIAFAPPPAVGF